MFKFKEKARVSFAADSVSIVSAGMKVHGDIDTEHDMRIDGAIKGNVYCKAKVVLGASGSIEGELHAVNADVMGTVMGNLSVKELLCLKSKCTINGNITVGHLNIEPDAEFNGTCTMAHGDGIVTGIQKAQLVLQN
jgi:cytoskeletal protein CcmA (bactofilin family)